MAISAGDIKLLASKVMLDVAEGGGGPTATVIADGVSNAVFPDISELDRTNGRVNARQLHVTVQSGDTATYLGSNVIVSEPPTDPNVSITLFSTGESFDTRTDAIARIEAYLSVGAAYAGYLFGNHIQGQRTLLVIQKGTAMPAIGDSLVLTKRAGYSDEYSQYVRVTDATLQNRTFTDVNGDFDRNVVTLSLSDALRADFPGFDASRIDIGKTALANATAISETIVADAARYYGVTTLEESAAIGDFTIKGASIFTQIVPSAQVETPVADARANQVSAALIQAGDEVYLDYAVESLAGGRTMYIGGGITPGSLRISPTSTTTITLLDSAGKLLSGSTQVGTVDYANGILLFTVDPSFGGYNTWRAYYKPGATADSIGQSQGFAVTQSNRSLSFVRTLEPAPAKGSTTVSYMSGGRWYVLQDDTSGAIRGSDSSFGAGSLNFTTGTLSVTMGALPDVGSAIIVQWVVAKTSLDSSVITLGSQSKFYWAFNTDGTVGVTPGSKSLTPGAVALHWTYNGAGKTSTDDGSGNLTGDATGTVDYANGIIRMSPLLLPPLTTAVTLDLVGPNKIGFSNAASTSGAYQTFSLGGAVRPGSVAFTMQGNLTFTYNGTSGGDWGVLYPDGFTDDGVGNIVMLIGRVRANVGTVNYSTGAVQISKTLSLNSGQMAEVARFANLYVSFVPASGFPGLYAAT